MSIQILDCTLRDGGYINDWKFGRKTITSILDKLESARIDIIECGFLTGMVQNQESSLFESVEKAEELLPKRERKAMYVAMIAIGEKELHPSRLAYCSGRGIGGIRLTFHKKEIKKAFEWAGMIMEKGYQVFMQPVGTVFYTDLELLKLVEQINELHPFAFYIVDTLGSMYRNEVSHRFYLIDENMKTDIHIGFHGHNNLQLAFSNAQVLGKIQTKRTLILDSSVYGMGRGAGNLPTELITQYINKKIHSRYDVTMVMDIYDEFISAIRKEYEWGYTLPYHIAATNLCHPGYAAYLINKRTLTMKDIERLILSIPKEKRVLYDKELIEHMYGQFQSRKIDDRSAVEELKRLVAGKKILLLAPGKSLSERFREIADFRKKEHPYTISVNFVDSRYGMDACFVSNHKRMDMIWREIRSMKGIRTILTSNVPADAEDGLCVDYDSYTNGDEMVSDNAGLMLLELLKKCQAKEVYLAGFDGFWRKYNGNYYSQELNLSVNEEVVQERQKRISQQLEILSREMKLQFLTPSVYENISGTQMDK